MMQILHGNVTSAFSLVYCDNFSHEKNLPLIMEVSQTQLCEFFCSLVMYLHTVLAHLSHFLTLVGMMMFSVVTYHKRVACFERNKYALSKKKRPLAHIT